MRLIELLGGSISIAIYGKMIGFETIISCRVRGQARLRAGPVLLLPGCWLCCAAVVLRALGGVSAGCSRSLLSPAACRMPRAARHW